MASQILLILFVVSRSFSQPKMVFSSFFKSRAAQGLSINVIIVMVLGLFILIVILVIVGAKLKVFASSDGCVKQGNTCVSAATGCDYNQYSVPFSCSSKTGEDLICCVTKREAV